MRALLLGSVQTAVALALGLGLGCALAPGCGGAPTDDTPTGAVELFLEAMERSDWDADARRTAYGLLAADAQNALDARADRANALSHDVLEPWEMLAQGRYRLRFTPIASGYREHIEGERATVTVHGVSEGQRANVPLVREDGHWRIVLEIAPLTPSAESVESAEGSP